MKIVDRGVVVEGGGEEDQRSCAFAGVCALPGGRWVCGFRAAPTKAATAGQKAMVSWSDDEGATWSSPAAPFEPPALEGRKGSFRGVYPTSVGADRLLASIMWVDVSDPALPFFNEQTEGLLDTRVFHAWSADGGATWTRPQPMDTSPFDVPTPLTGPALVLPDGELACQFELNKHYYDTSVWRHSSVLMFSKDGGRSWPEHSIVSHDPANRFFWWDQRPGVLEDGRILVPFWTYDNQAATYLNIHARESLDRGRTWSPLWDTGVPGQPAQPVSLADGRVAMVYVDRTAEPVIKVRVSGDHGRSWPAETELVISQPASASQTWNKGSMQDAWAEMGKFSLGLPATARLGDGDVLVVYYNGPATDLTSIEWVRLRA